MLDDKVKRGRGRPRKNGSFNKKITFHANEDYVYMKKALEDELGKNGGEVMREALEMLYKIHVYLK